LISPHHRRRRGNVIDLELGFIQKEAL